MYKIGEMRIFSHSRIDTGEETTVWITVVGFRRGFGTESTLEKAILKAILDSASLKTSCPFRLFLSRTLKTGFKAVLRGGGPRFLKESMDPAVAIATVYLSFFDTLVTV